MADIYFEDWYQDAPDSCQPDITIPVFAGITGATPNTDGSITVTWGAITSSKSPLDVHIYIALGSVSAGVLFQPSNVAIHIPADKFQGKVFLLADEITYLVKGQQYTLGIRANDAFGYMDSNTVTQVVTAIASGNLPAIFQTIVTDLQDVHVDFQADHVDFQADHANFVADDAAFDADHANFVADDAAYDANNAALAAEIADLAALSNSLVSALAPTKLSVKIKPQQKLNISIKEGS